MPIANQITKEQYARALKKAEREKWERVFSKQLDAMNWIYNRQYKFHPTRDWVYDFIIIR